MKFKGKAVKKKFAAASKSEHLAIYLVTDDDEYVLQEIGGNPFQNKNLEALVGHEVEIEGIVDRGRLLVKKEALEKIKEKADSIRNVAGRRSRKSKD